MSAAATMHTCEGCAAPYVPGELDWCQECGASLTPGCAHCGAVAADVASYARWAELPPYVQPVCCELTSVSVMNRDES